jgi:hypothetical protein
MPAYRPPGWLGMSAVEPSDPALAAALRWVDWHGSLIEYECSTAVAAGLFFAMHQRALVVRRAIERGSGKLGRSRLVLTEAGRAFLAAGRNVATLPGGRGRAR